MISAFSHQHINLNSKVSVTGSRATSVRKNTHSQVVPSLEESQLYLRQQKQTLSIHRK